MQEVKDIKLHSRYADVNTIFHQISDNEGIIFTNSRYNRHILSNKNEDVIEAIDFEGGPMLNVGDTLNSKKIKSIRTVYYIELE